MLVKANEFCIPIASFWAHIYTFRGTPIASFVVVLYSSSPSSKCYNPHS